jgi:uncharacterized protein (TIGR02596 family)
MKNHSSRAFTLLELLVVISVGILLAGLSLPAFNAISRGTQLSQSAQTLLNELSFARQSALSKNRIIEVRFYKLPKTPGSSTASQYRAVQSFEIDDSGTATALGKIQWLTSPVIIDHNSAISTLLDSSRAKTWTTADPQISLPQIGTSYEATAFRFQPNGSTDLSQLGQQWFVTLHNGNEGDNLTKLPTNYYTIQINPLNGSVQSYRP